MLLERTDQAISSTDLQKNARVLLDRIENGSQDRYVIFRDNCPTAVMLPTQHYEALMTELEDLRIEAIARDRLSAFKKVKLISHADMVARIGSNHQ